MQSSAAANQPSRRPCATCQRRKVRCTGERPACSACKKHAITLGLEPETFVCKYNDDPVFTPRPVRPSSGSVSVPLTPPRSSQTAASSPAPSFGSLSSYFDGSPQQQRKNDKRSSSLSLNSTASSAAASSHLSVPPPFPIAMQSRPAGPRKQKTGPKLALQPTTKRPSVFKHKSHPVVTKNVATQTTTAVSGSADPSALPGSRDVEMEDMAASPLDAYHRSSQRRHTFPYAQLPGPFQSGYEIESLPLLPVFPTDPSTSPSSPSEYSSPSELTFAPAALTRLGRQFHAPHLPYVEPRILANSITSERSAAIEPSTPPKQNPWTTMHAPHLTLSPSLSSLHYLDDDGDVTSSPLDDFAFHVPTP
ncbi:hypothetical protein OIV83_000367 [Microbotryomycetes sp. JL201]|nr:hypothetical protein OIV83_000367 [Microbotryomycetes sp. JL201]